MATILSQVVEVCVFKIVETEPKYLLLQRASDDLLYPNIWQLVTGTIKQNESAINAAIRELDEETGLQVKRLWTIPSVDSYFDIARDVVQIVPVFAVEGDDKPDLHLSPEHQNFQWLTYSLAREVIVWPGQKYIVDIVHEFIIGGKEAGRLSQITQL